MKVDVAFIDGRLATINAQKPPNLVAAAGSGEIQALQIMDEKGIAHNFNWSSIKSFDVHPGPAIAIVGADRMPIGEPPARS